MNIIRHYGGYLVRYLRGTRGVAAMEYAIIVGVVVVGVGAAVAAFQDEINGNYWGCDSRPHDNSHQCDRMRILLSNDARLMFSGLAA